MKELLKSVFPEVIHHNELQLELSKSFIKLIYKPLYEIANLVECRKGEGTELVVLDINVDLGQRPTLNDIQLTERIGILISHSALLPEVYPVRENFPQNVPHLNQGYKGMVRSLCLYNMYPEDAIRNFTPLRFIEKIRWWLKETAYNRLHHISQPLDPLFASSTTNIILPAGYSENDKGFYIGKKYSSEKHAPILLHPAHDAEVKGEINNKGLMATLIIKTPPILHGSVRWLPRTFLELLEAYKEFGSNIKSLLAESFRDWSGDQHIKHRLSLPLLIVIITPLKRENGAVEGESRSAFYTGDISANQILSAFPNYAIEGEYIVPVLMQENSLDETKLESIAIVPVNIYTDINRELAQDVSGYAIKSSESIGLIGAGAIGSQLAINAIRGGLGNWEIIDPDFLLPHNLVRHALPPRYIGVEKAYGIEVEINQFFEEGKAKGHILNVDRPPEINATGSWRFP